MSSRSAGTEQPAVSPASPTESQSERLDRIFSLLKNRRRRLVLEYLRTHESTTQSDLARHVAAVENGVDEATVTSTQRKRVYVSLYQAHLPKLDDFDAVSFDRERGTVERTPHTGELLAYLDRFDGRDAQPRRSKSLDVGPVSLLAAALVAVFVGELGVVSDDLSLGLAVLLSLAGAGAAVYATRTGR
jgi:hypothetical protein